MWFSVFCFGKSPSSLVSSDNNLTGGGSLSCRTAFVNRMATQMPMLGSVQTVSPQQLQCLVWSVGKRFLAGRDVGCSRCNTRAIALNSLPLWQTGCWTLHYKSKPLERVRPGLHFLEWTEKSDTAGLHFWKLYLFTLLFLFSLKLLYCPPPKWNFAHILWNYDFPGFLFLKDVDQIVNIPCWIRHQDAGGFFSYWKSFLKKAVNL